MTVVYDRAKVIEIATELAEKRWKKENGQWVSTQIERDCWEAVQEWAQRNPLTWRNEERIDSRPWRNPTNWEYRNWDRAGDFNSPQMRAPMPPIPCSDQYPDRTLWYDEARAAIWPTHLYHVRRAWWRPNPEEEEDSTVWNQ